MPFIKTISNETHSELNDRNSKFLGFLFPCKNVGVFDIYLQKIKTQFPDASHHCYAYRILQNELLELANDDGEPGGTAGMPILNRLKSYDLYYAGLIVVRYFGGTKLGKPGLIRAYGTCAGLCLDQTSITKLYETQKITITFPYQESNRIEKLIHFYRCNTEHSEYLENVTYQINCPIEKVETLAKELSHYRHLEITFDLGEKKFTSL